MSLFLKKHCKLRLYFRISGSDAENSCMFSNSMQRESLHPYRHTEGVQVYAPLMDVQLLTILNVLDAAGRDALMISVHRRCLHIWPLHAVHLDLESTQTKCIYVSTMETIWLRVVHLKISKTILTGWWRLRLQASKFLPTLLIFSKGRHEVERM